MPWPMPRTVAKTIRATVGKDGVWTDEERKQFAKMAMRGPLMVAKATNASPWEVYVPAPNDVVFFRETDNENRESKPLFSMILRPEKVNRGEGVLGLPAPKPIKVMKEGKEIEGNGATKAFGNVFSDQHGCPAVMRVTEDVKPARDVPAWWRLEDAYRWLTYGGKADTCDTTFREWLPFNPTDCEREETQQFLKGFSNPITDERVHVSIDPTSQTHVEGALFTTESLAFPSGHVSDERASGKQNPPPAAMAMLVRLDQAPAMALPTVVALGGERRLSLVSESGQAGATVPAWPTYAGYAAPDGWEGATGIRLQLVTPAIFRFGWLPGWMADGVIPGLGGMGVQVKLIGAAMERRVPVSGWFTHRRSDVPRRAVPLEFATSEEQSEHTKGPAATDFAVPAGSVYFFRVTKGTLNKDHWNALWLASVCDLEADRNQGFGLVLPGIWDAAAFDSTTTGSSATTAEEGAHS